MCNYAHTSRIFIYRGIYTLHCVSSEIACIYLRIIQHILLLHIFVYTSLNSIFQFQIIERHLNDLLSKLPDFSEECSKVVQKAQEISSRLADHIICVLT